MGGGSNEHSLNPLCRVVNSRLFGISICNIQYFELPVSEVGSVRVFFILKDPVSVNATTVTNFVADRKMAMGSNIL